MHLHYWHANIFIAVTLYDANNCITSTQQAHFYTQIHIPTCVCMYIQSSVALVNVLLHLGGFGYNYFISFYFIVFVSVNQLVVYKHLLYKH